MLILVVVDGKWNGEVIKRDERFIYVRYNLGRTEVDAIMSPDEFARRVKVQLPGDI